MKFHLFEVCSHATKTLVVLLGYITLKFDNSFTGPKLVHKKIEVLKLVNKRLS